MVNDVLTRLNDALKGVQEQCEWFRITGNTKALKAAEYEIQDLKKRIERLGQLPVSGGKEDVNDK